MLFLQIKKGEVIENTEWHRPVFLLFPFEGDDGLHGNSWGKLCASFLL